MRRTLILLAVLLTACMIFVVLNVPTDKPLPLQGSLIAINPDAGENSVSQSNTSSTRLVAPRGPSLSERREDACDDVLDSGQEDSLEQLTKLYFTIDSVHALELCELDSDRIGDFLQNELLPRIEEGDASAAKMAYAIAGAQCGDSPRRIDSDCKQIAEDEQQSLSQWRECVQGGYTAYRECTESVLNEHGVPSAPVTMLYLVNTPQTLMQQIDQTKDGEVAPEDVLEQLEMVTSDRMMTEAISANDAGVIANKLFGLSYRVGCDGDKELQERINKMTVFWGRRYEVEYLAKNEEGIPFEESYVTNTP